mmetsp:Transcript_10883/g.25216  ORF Transcript_10883/g.25216 Transcript_10883/m.25216 type:complete len:165 (+) Transcript_10883:137-631(+)
MEELIESQRATCSLILAVALFLICIHVIFMVTNVLLSSLSFFLVWNEIFRIQRPSGTPMARGVVTKAFEKGSMAAAAAAGSGESTCPICLSEYQVGDVVSHGKSCLHTFHNDCLCRWLQRDMTCPCCRTEVMERFDECNESASFLAGDSIGVLDYFKLSMKFLS